MRWSSVASGSSGEKYGATGASGRAVAGVLWCAAVVTGGLRPFSRYEGVKLLPSYLFVTLIAIPHAILPTPQCLRTAASSNRPSPNRRCRKRWTGRLTALRRQSRLQDQQEDRSSVDVEKCPDHSAQEIA